MTRIGTKGKKSPETQQRSQQTKTLLLQIGTEMCTLTYVLQKLSLRRVMLNTTQTSLVSFQHKLCSTSAMQTCLNKPHHLILFQFTTVYSLYVQSQHFKFKYKSSSSWKEISNAFCLNEDPGNGLLALHVLHNLQ